MPRPLIEFIFSQFLPWKNGIKVSERYGVLVKILSLDELNGDCSAIIRYPPGWKNNYKEAICAEEEIYILDGEITINDTSYVQDDYACFPKGFARNNSYTDSGCDILTFFSEKPGIITPYKQNFDKKELIEKINVIEMPWDSSSVDKKLEFMGIRRKVLKWDKQYNQKRTFLLSTSPHNFPKNWKCPQITHPCVEEAFVLAGEISGPNGVMTRGSYFWRPANVPHGPFGSHDGCLMLIRFIYGKHINIWSEKPKDFSYRPKYKPDVPNELKQFAQNPYTGIKRY